MMDRVAWVIVGAVVGVWLITTLILPFLVRGYTPPPSVSTVMGSVAGGAAAYLFASHSDRTRRNNRPKRKPRNRKEGDE